MTNSEALTSSPVPRPPSWARRCCAGVLGLASAAGVGTLMGTVIIRWGVAAIIPTAVAGILVMATVVFSICALLGIDPGPGGEHLRGMVRDILRRPS